MDIENAVETLSALASETRLRVFRLLVQSGEDGLPSTEIARRLGVPKALMSTHLNVLTRSGLAASRREGRRIIYTLNFGQTRGLLSFLVENCCQGNPDVCSTLLDTTLPLFNCEDNISSVR